MAKVRAQLFASPVLFRGGQPLAIPRKKALALFAVLAVEPSARPRDALCGLLWPALDPSRARAALRSALWDLQQTLGESAIVATRHALGCSPSAEVDVVELRRSLEAAAEADRGGRMDEVIASLERAVSLYRGDFLHGFHLPDEPAFAEWQAAQTEQLRAARWAATNRLADLFAARGDTERALLQVERMLAIAPLDQAVHRRMIRLLSQSGDRAAALEQYARCVRVLAEHRREPDPETRALYEAIRGDAPLERAQAEEPAISKVTLPAANTPLVGREQDLERVLSRLREPHGRVVTITGTGGVGKTRLAIEAAHRLSRELEHGARFVSLAAVTAPEHVAPAVAEAARPARLGSTPPPPLDPISLLRDQHTLLVLDGFEHVLGAVPWLADLVASAPRLRVLATSRERLHLRGEWEVPLTGLPRTSADPDAAAPAIELFVQSASRANPSFAVRPEQRRDIARVCDLLEGIPLGIELAGAWVHHYGVTEIARRLEEDLDFLTAPRDAPQSHRSLRATFARSWGLLSPTEQGVLRGLSIFRAPFDERAAAAVADATGGALAALGTKFLLHRVAGGRYMLHQLIQRYAAEELAASPDGGRGVAARHRAYFLDLCRRFSGDLPAETGSSLLRQLDESEADVRAAFAAAAAERAFSELDDALLGFFTALEVCGRDHLAAEIADATARILRTQLAEATRGRALLRRLLGRLLARKARAGLEHLPMAAVVDTLAESLRLLRRTSATADVCYVLNAEGRLAAREGDLALARRRFREALRLRKETGDRRGIAIGCNNLSVIACAEGDYAKAERLLRRSLRIFRSLDDRRSIVACLSSLGGLHLGRGDLDAAEAALREGLALGREAGDRFSLAMLHVFLGSTLLAADKIAGADASFDEALAIGRSGVQEEAIAAALLGLGTTSRLLGDLDRAQRSLEESLVLWRKLGGKPKISEAQAALGLVHAARRRPHEARVELLDALQRASELGTAPLVLDVLVSIAEARAFGVAHAVETAEVVAAHPAADRLTARRAARVLTSIGTSSGTFRRDGADLAGILQGMLSVRR